MAGLDPAIHVLLQPSERKYVDARDRPGHDGGGRGGAGYSPKRGSYPAFFARIKSAKRLNR
jgi:hypothetical protein